jgi:hypothetical protein
VREGSRRQGDFVRCALSACLALLSHDVAGAGLLAAAPSVKSSWQGAGAPLKDIEIRASDSGSSVLLALCDRLCPPHSVRVAGAPVVHLHGLAADIAASVGIDRITGSAAVSAATLGSTHPSLCALQ